MTKPLFPDITVNGQTISAADIAAEAQNHAAPQGKPGIAWRLAARALIIRALLLEEAARLGLAAAPQLIAKGQSETTEEALIRGAMELGVSPAPVSVDQARARYEASPDQFRAPTLFEAAHILFAADPADPAARQKAKTRADAALAVLSENADQFAALAGSQSDCPSRDVGGRLGQIGPGDTVSEFESALGEMDEGEMSTQPLESRYGFHIVRLDARANGEILPFEAVQPALMEALEKAAWTKSARQFTAALVGAADISGIDMSQSVAAA